MKSIDINPISKFTGFKNYRDITNLPITDITAGSQNVLIDDGAKLSCRGGSRYLGAEGTVGVQTNDYWAIAHRIHSNYDTFVGTAGVTLPIRMYYSGTTAVGDVMQVYLPTYTAGVANTTKQWYTVSQFTTPTNPLLSNHRWYFAEWWDAVKLVPDLVFCAGTNKIRSWQGAFAPITVVGATTLQTTATWASLGFINAADGGSDTIIINGVAYVTNGNFSTNTVTIPLGTAGVTVNNVAFSDILSYTTSDNVIFDVCSMLNNQVYYIDWRQRNVLVSWNRNQSTSLSFQTYSGTSGLDDAIFTGPFTGDSTDVYTVIIDSTTPAINNTVFTGTGANDFLIDATAFTGTAGEKFTYVLTTTGNASMTLSTLVGFSDGDRIVGQTSGAQASIVEIFGANIFVANVTTTGLNFTPGETVEKDNGTTATLTGVSFLSNFYSATRNGLQLYINADFTVGLASATDGLEWGWINQGFHNVGDTWTVTIRKAKADTFSWEIDGVKQASNVAITGAAQALGGEGITVDFVNTTGHAQGDKWTVTANPKIQFGYRNFTFKTPTRLPGEGFKILLDSNGWTMKPQEQYMYINASGGEYYQVQTKLSSSLTSETLSVERLKTEPQFKALYPYLMGYMENYIATIILEKSFNILGRQDFVELPQMRTLSDEVKVTFETGDWEDANITYGKTKTFFSLPKSGIVIIYDNFMKYFHSPMVFPRRVANISFIDDMICGHSYEKNETYELFTDELNDLGEYAISSKIVFPYFDDDQRFQQKSTSAIALDGYMTGNPQMKWRVNLGVGGCDGSPNGEVNPIFCYPTDTASLGKSSLGYHGLGNSPADVIPHFKFGKTFTPGKYYLKNMEISCDGLEQRWSIVAIGTNMEQNDLNNSNMFNITN